VVGFATWLRSFGPIAASHNPPRSSAASLLRQATLHPSANCSRATLHPSAAELLCYAKLRIIIINRRGAAIGNWQLAEGCSPAKQARSTQVAS